MGETGLLLHIRSLIGLAAIGISFLLGEIFEDLFIWPLAWLFPSTRIPLISGYMLFFARLSLGCLRLGGAHFVRKGSIPTDRPVLILMNHQSLADIPTGVIMCSPYSPAPVTRKRYGRGVPLVSSMVMLRRCPVVDPDKDRKGAIATLSAASRREEHGLLIFPEEHRSTDGKIAPFNSGGVRVILRERRMPVYLVVTDGFWVGRSFKDFLLNMGRINGRSEVLGPFEPPSSNHALEAFVGKMRDLMVSRLEEFRDAQE